MDKIFETNSGFHVKYCTTGKFKFPFFKKASKYYDHYSRCVEVFLELSRLSFMELFSENI